MALQLIGTLGGNGTPAVGIPVGGSTGQVLAKSSSENYATIWVDPPGQGEFEGTADNIPDGTTKVIMTTGERSKLSGMAPNATANATNESLRDRQTHTGTQDISTITNLGSSLSTLETRSLPAGGTTGQVLTKNSGANYSASWTTPLQGLNDATGLWIGTQAQYNAIASPLPTVVYVIK